MGHKQSHPLSLRLGSENRYWNTIWCTENTNYMFLLHEFLEIQKYLFITLQKIPGLFLYKIESRLRFKQIQLNVFFIYLKTKNIKRFKLIRILSFLKKKELALCFFLNKLLRFKKITKITFFSRQNDFFLKKKIILTRERNFLFSKFHSKLYKKQYLPLMKTHFSFYKNAIWHLFETTNGLPLINVLGKLLQKCNCVKPNTHQNIIKNCCRLIAQSFFKLKLPTKIIGLKFDINGRLNGSRKSRQLLYKYGHTSNTMFSQHINFLQKKCYTKFGVFGLKLYIFYELKIFHKKPHFLLKKKYIQKNIKKKIYKKKKIFFQNQKNVNSTTQTKIYKNTKKQNIP